jgi:hemoglobin-like flavoprotein
MDLTESLHEILEQKDKLADLFYLVFLEHHPDVQRFFFGVDMKRQNTLLTMALIVVERYAQGEYAVARSYLRMLGEKHLERGIPRDAYPKWREAMMGTLERFHGPRWNSGLADQWANALDSAITAVLTAYP